MMDKQLKKLQDLEKQLTLFRDDFSCFASFVERNIRQGKKIIELEKEIKELKKQGAGE
ncbi:hypothetical protein BMS3Abin17_01240 [archaeon BMS3Abin17]|nr:hypothetical protein BMS3Abin17_01240 [archaeon BMS3Abin17]